VTNLHIISFYKLHDKLSCESLSACRVRVEPSGIWAILASLNKSVKPIRRKTLEPFWRNQLNLSDFA